MANLKQDARDAWRRLADGWRHLGERAAGAMTYFNPGRTDPDADGVRWGLLAAEVVEKADRFQVSLEAPGLDRDEIDIVVEDRHLLVTGTKRHESESVDGDVRVTERAFGAFQRLVPLPAEVTADGASASYRRGVLKVEVPKRRQASSSRVTVVAG